MIPLFKVFMAKEAAREVAEVLSSGYVGEGEKVKEFEFLLQNHFQNPYVATVNSCTSGLHLALDLGKSSAYWENIGEDTSQFEVLTTPLTCLHGESYVKIDSDKFLKIREIVEKKYDGDIISFNIITKKFEKKKIIGWHKSPLGNRFWIRLNHKNSKNSNNKLNKKSGIWITNDHKILTIDGYKKAEELTDKDKVITNEKLPNSAQKEFLLGCMLGDSHIQKCHKKANKRCRLTIGHTKKNKDYTKLKNKILANFGSKLFKKKAYKQTKESHYIQTSFGYAWQIYRDRFYKGETKILPKDLDVEFSNLTLAIWFMDDGSRLKESAIICTDNFSLKENIRLISVLKHKFNINATLTKTTKNKWRIYIPKESASILFETIAPYVVESMRYKLPEKIEQKYPFNENLWELGHPENFIDEIEIIKNIKPKGERKYVYCIDVEDNHNFVSGNLILHNCTATNLPIIKNNLKIKWVDIDPKTCNLDLDDLSRKLSPKTKFVMLVHWGGYPVDLDKLEEIKDKYYKLYGHTLGVIEDCAHAWGANYKEKLIGNSGNTCVFSFQAIKHFTTVDGGIIISPTEMFDKRVRLARWYGLDRNSGADFRCSQNITEPGFKFHMNNVNAAIGIANYPHTENIVRKHKQNGQFYNEALQNVPGVTLLENEKDRDPSYWIYTIFVEKREDFARKMKEQGIAVSQVHDRNDKHNCFKEFKCYLPNLDEISRKMICLYGESRVKLENGKNKPIRELVNKKYNGLVKTYNPKTNEFENKKIIGWYKNKFEDRKWVRINCLGNNETGGKYSRKKGIWLTDDHKILTDKGYVEAAKLKTGTKVITDFADLNPKQKEVLIGTLLGDSNISENRLTITHSSKQAEWLNTKKTALKQLAGDIKPNKKGLYFRSLFSPIWQDFERNFYNKNKKKIVPKNLKLSPLSLATWYMDDGSRQKDQIYICSESFTMSENLFLMEIMEKTFGIKSNLQRIRSGKCRIHIGNGYNTHNSSTLFFKTIAPYIVPCLRYKLPENIEREVPYDSQLWNLGDCVPLINKIEVVKNKKPKKANIPYVYCIDVADNHNFISSNIICHNCIPCGWWVSEEDREYIVDCIKEGW